jgi:hypothetical protein
MLLLFLPCMHFFTLFLCSTVIHVLMLHNHSVLHLGGILCFPAEGNELLRSNLFRSADLIPAELTIKKFRMKNTL